MYSPYQYSDIAWFVPVPAKTKPGAATVFGGPFEERRMFRAKSKVMLLTTVRMTWDHQDNQLTRPSPFDVLTMSSSVDTKTLSSPLAIRNVDIVRSDGGHSVVGRESLLEGAT
jgi:hypothetical protein